MIHAILCNVSGVKHIIAVKELFIIIYTYFIYLKRMEMYAGGLPRLTLSHIDTK